MRSVLVRALRLVATSWTLLGLTLVCFIMLESGLSLFFVVKDKIDSMYMVPSDWRVLADAYRNAPWAPGYFAEFSASDHLVWEPYLYWRRIPFRGHYINVTASGRRYTPTPQVTGLRANHRLPKIFVFGGSTVWGTGARDSATIPALIAASLYRRGTPVDVTNMGETGYVSTQELISLELEIRKGNIPDLVVFYDGINDTFSAYQGGYAGVPQNESNRAKEFNLTNIERRNDLRFIWLRVELRSSSTYRLIDAVTKKLGIDIASQPGISMDEDRARAGSSVVSLYRKNIRLATELSEQYGFRIVSYWQPTILDKSRLTKYENQVRSRWSENLKRFFDETYRSMRDGSRFDLADPAVRDMSGIFADVEGPIFIDSWHLGERGNQIVAEKIAQDVLALLPKTTG